MELEQNRQKFSLFPHVVQATGHKYSSGIWGEANGCVNAPNNQPPSQDCDCPLGYFWSQTE